MSDRQVAVIVGVGPGLGFALVRRFARAGMAVALAARSRERLEQLLASGAGRGRQGLCLRCHR